MTVTKFAVLHCSFFLIFPQYLRISTHIYTITYYTYYVTPVLMKIHEAL